ncbi:MAG TPA: L,D-transpeptidase [Abditibacteriaceae bacterium]
MHAKALRLVVEKEPRWWQFEGKAALSQHPTLFVYAGQKLVKAYPAALGYDPIGDKQKRNDYRTPEGKFYLCGRNAQSKFYKSLRLNYPNAEDAARGLRQGLINRATHNRIVRANRRGGVPPQDTDLGGDIMIHGGGIGSNWTWGCIALENSAVQELFDFLSMNTPIEIRAARR